MRLISLLLLVTALIASAAPEDDEPARLYRRVYSLINHLRDDGRRNDPDNVKYDARVRAEALEALRDIQKRFPKWRPDVVASGLKALAVAAAAPASAAPPGADPFVKEKPPAAPPKPAAGDPEAYFIAIDGGTVLRIAVETWSLSLADFLAVLDAPTAEHYPRITALSAAGRARLENVIAVTTRSGQRAVVEAIDEVRYPDKWETPAGEGEPAFPTSYETRNVGDTLEVEPVLGPDGTIIDVNLLPQTVRFAGFRAWRAEPRAEP